MSQLFWHELQGKLVELLIVVPSAIAMGLLGAFCVRLGLKAKKLGKIGYAYLAAGTFFVVLRLCFAIPLLLFHHTSGFENGRLLSFFIKAVLAFIYGLMALHFFRGRLGFGGKRSQLWVDISLWTFVTYFYRNVFFS